MISALLLANAGVPADDIFADYAASVRAMATAGPQMEPTTDRQASWKPAEVSHWLSYVESFVRTFVERVDVSMSELHVDGALRARLRSLLTRP